MWQSPVESIQHSTQTNLNLYRILLQKSSQSNGTLTDYDEPVPTFHSPQETETLPMLQNCDRSIHYPSQFFLHLIPVLTCDTTTTCHFTIQDTELMPKSSFSVSVIPLWNSLHPNLVSSSSCNSFKVVRLAYFDRIAAFKVPYR